MTKILSVVPRRPAGIGPKDSPEGGRCLQQQFENAERKVPMPGLRVFQVGLNKLEHAPEGDGEAAGNAGKLGVRIITEDQVKRGPG
jgi:hypothetical protein